MLMRQELEAVENFVKTHGGPVYAHAGWNLCRDGSAYCWKHMLGPAFRESRPGDEIRWLCLYKDDLANQTFAPPPGYQGQEARDWQRAARYEEGEQAFYEIRRLEALDQMSRGGLMMTDDVRRCLQTRAEAPPWSWRRRVRTLLQSLSAWRSGHRKDAPHQGIRKETIIYWLGLQLDYARRQAQEEKEPCSQRQPKSTTPSTPPAAAAIAPPP
jgi:hypothetical protein